MMEIQFSKRNKATAKWLASLICISFLVIGSAKASNYFSMNSNINVLSDPNYMDKISDAGAHACRIDSLAFSLVRAEPNTLPDRWKWASAEKMRQINKRHPEVAWLAILGYGTQWAQDPKFAKMPGDATGAPQRGVNIMPAESPNNLYGNYVYETVRRYKDCIHLWESWNEPDLPGNVFFKGNGADFMPYQKACYLAAKRADPNCTVLFAGLAFANIEGYLYSHHLKPPTTSPAHSSFFEDYLREVVKDPDAKANNYYFDVMNQHSYSRATDFADYCQIQKKLMKEYLGVEKPIWLTETGFIDKGGPWGGSSDDYCDYLLQTYAWSMLSGVQRNFHFQFDNSNGHGLYTEMPGGAKPALQTYKFLSHEFADAQFVKQWHGRNGIGFLEGNFPYKPTWTTGYNLFELKSKDGKKHFWIAFTDTDKDVTIKVPATSGNATLFDRHAASRPIHAVNSFYELHLQGAKNLAGFPTLSDAKAKALGVPEHLVGGSTQVIIE